MLTNLYEYKNFEQPMPRLKKISLLWGESVGLRYLCSKTRNKFHSKKILTIETWEKMKDYRNKSGDIVFKNVIAVFMRCSSVFSGKVTLISNFIVKIKRISFE